MSAISHYIEFLQTLTRPGSDDPGALCSDIGVEYLYPIIPPFFSTYFASTIASTIAARNFTAYATVFYRIKFGYIVPGAFNLNIRSGGVSNYSGTITGYALEDGIDCLFFMTPEKFNTFYITNLTPLNQHFEMVSRYLLIQSEADWKLVKKYLKMANFPYKLPEEL